MILVDHGSRDRTPEILERFAAESRIPTSLHHVRNPAVSHDLIKGYAGQSLWLFGVDGDELYDRERLLAFKPRLLSGEYRDCWQIKGNVLHCTELADDRTAARGYPAPPNSSMTKLFNFGIIESWEGETPERLHGPSIVFKEPYEFNQHMLNRRYSWDESPFRCLHLTFLRRSSRDRGRLPRRNLKDANAPRRLPRRLWGDLLERMGFAARSSWKLEHYRHGELVTVSAEPFFRGAR